MLIEFPRIELGPFRGARAVTALAGRATERTGRENGTANGRADTGWTALGLAMGAAPALLSLGARRPAANGVRPGNSIAAAAESCGLNTVSFLSAAASAGAIPGTPPVTVHRVTAVIPFALAPSARPSDNPAAPTSNRRG